MEDNKTRLAQPEWNDQFPSFKLLNRPGTIAMIGVILPHVLIFPLALLDAPGMRSLPPFDIPWEFVEFLLSVAAILGLCCAFLALRIARQPDNRADFHADMSKKAAVAALWIFAFSALNPAAALTYGSLLHFPEARHHKGRSGFRNELIHSYQFYRQAQQDTSTKHFPPLSYTEPNKPIPYREFTKTLSEGGGVPFCQRWDDRAFFYPGVVLRSDAEVERFAESCLATLPECKKGDLFPLEAAGFKPLGNYALPSQTPGLPLTPMAWQGIPLLIERVPLEEGTKARVLYADLHEEVLTYPGKWPMTEATMTQLHDLAEAVERAWEGN